MSGHQPLSAAVDDPPAPPASLNLRDDRKLIRELLDRFAGELDTDRRAQRLRLAIDLFDLQCRLADLAGLRSGNTAPGPLFDLIEVVEMTHPTGRLYVARGRELAGLMNAELARQDQLDGEHGAVGSVIEPELLRYRARIVACARKLIAPQPTPGIELAA